MEFGSCNPWRPVNGILGVWIMIFSWHGIVCLCFCLYFSIELSFS